MIEKKRKFSLARKEIIKNKIVISEIINSGRRIQSGFLKLFFKKSEESKAAFCISNRSGNAVRRNKYKRWLRELYRLNKYDIKGSYEIVFVINVQKEIVEFEIFRNCFFDVFNRLNGLNENNQ
ncbi:ribonuclease P protein component [candidate division KSB1 bacterium]